MGSAVERLYVWLNVLRQVENHQVKEAVWATASSSSFYVIEIGHYGFRGPASEVISFAADHSGDPANGK